MPLAIAMSLPMWGIVHQGHNAVFPSFYPGLVPTRTRVTAMAISQNIGTTITAILPALFAAVAPPGNAGQQGRIRADAGPRDGSRIGLTRPFAWLWRTRWTPLSASSR